MEFYKSLVYVPIQEPTKWDLDNLDHIILTPYHSWYPSSINNELEYSVILPNNNKVDDYLYDWLHQINDVDLHLNNYYSYSEVDYMFIWINNQCQKHSFLLNTI